MCYMLFLSTDSQAELSESNTELLCFSKELPGLPEERLLEYPNKWFVGSAQGCSCGFRHLCSASIELGFGIPEDWFPEDADDIEATHQFIRVVRSLRASGAAVECIDAWCDDNHSVSLKGTVQVNLDEIPDVAFRFYENQRLVFVGGT